MKLFEREKLWLLEEKYHGIKTPDYFNDVKLLSAGEPLAFLIGNQPFLDCTIDLTYRPLIPRTETEYWVDQVITEINQIDGDLEILDLFSGSGCIGVAVLKHCPHAHVTFGEINPDFVSQIQINLDLNEIDPSRYEIIQTNVFKNIGLSDNPIFDYILTNPPYIQKNGPSAVQKSVADYEDHRSLFADDQGLYFVKKLLAEAPDYLKPGGHLYIEFDPWQTEILTPLLKNQSVWQWSYITDQFCKDRVLKLVKN